MVFRLGTFFIFVVFARGILCLHCYLALTKIFLVDALLGWFKIRICCLCLLLVQLMLLLIFYMWMASLFIVAILTLILRGLWIFFSHYGNLSSQIENWKNTFTYLGASITVAQRLKVEY